MNLQRFWQERNKTVILRIPQENWRQQRDYANRFPQCQVISWREEVLRQVRPGQRRLNITSQGEIDRLREWCRTYSGKLLVIIHTDYMLTKQKRTERQAFWRRLLHGMPHLECVVVSVVLDSSELLPTNLIEWQRERRVLTVDKERKEVVFDGIED